LDKIIQNQQIPFDVEKKILSTTITRQIVIYLVSFFLPPFGLGWAFKYIRSDDEKAKKIGWIAVILTIVSLLLTFWVSKAFMDKITQSINSQMQIEDFNY
jgi:amino acid transporter